MELVVKTRDGTPITHDVTKNTVRMVGADGKTVEFIPADSASAPGTGDTPGKPIIAEPEWLDNVCFWDYDGTLIRHLTVAEANQMTELPPVPAHDGLTFLGWNYTLGQVQATEYPLDIGAMYIPTDGNTHLHLSVTDASKLAVPVYWTQTAAHGVAFDWGDGSAATTVDGTGAVSTTHTYGSTGEYDVTITVDSGAEMAVGSGADGVNFIGGKTSLYRDYLTALHVGRNVGLSAYALIGSHNLSVLTIPNAVVEIPSSACSSLDTIRALIIPDSVRVIAQNAILYVGGAQKRLHHQPISIPESVVELNSGNLARSNGPLRISLPKSISAIGTSTINYMHRMRRLFLPDTITSIGTSNFYYCYSLEQLKLPNALEELPQFCVSNLPALKQLQLPSKLRRTTGYYAVSTLGIEDLVIPKTLESVGSNSLTESLLALRRVVYCGTVVPAIKYNSDAVAEIIYLSETVPETVEDGFDYTEIYVPDIAYDAYCAKFGANLRFRIHKLGEYSGELPKYE